MQFNHDDIINTLYFESGGVAGSYNHLFPAINPSYAQSELLSILLSNHERAHADLNSKSCYGVYLSLLSFLQHKTILKTTSVFLQKQSLLVQQCRIVHEVYATFSSVQSYAFSLDSAKFNNPIDDNPEYMRYYNLGQQISGHVTSYIIRQTFLFACCTYCFLSKAITEELMIGIGKFELRNCRSIEFPDQRFYYLLEKVKEIDVPMHVQLFNTILKRKGEKDFLVSALNGSFEADHFDLNTHLLVLDSLHSYFVDILKRHFDDNCGISLSITDCENMRTSIVNAVKNEFPFEMNNEFLFEHKPRGSIDRHLFLQYENEKILIWNKKPKCILLIPAEVPSEVKSEIYTKENEDYHLMLEVICTSDLLAQYEFIHSDDRMWIAASDKILIVLKQTAVTELDDLLVYMLAFENPEEVIAFFYDRPAFYPIFGMFSFTALIICLERKNNWADSIKKLCFHSYFINDLSLLFVLEEYFEVPQGINYSMITTDVLGTDYSALVFMIQNEIGDVDFMLVPGSVMFIVFALEYIQKNYPVFTYIAEETDFHTENGNRIMRHIFTEKYMVGFKDEITD
jgi:hypothetical protein